ncbi:methyltransferase [Granulicella sp. S190]|uniref:methyltransferase n=1 Tax=Granulicella sp. S190 TaxID=1747226 RepID=UPI00131ADC99|nr:methyltransferase [Granulicella sp. S190]
MQSTTPSPQEQILSIILGFWQARSLALVTELHIAEHLADGPLDVAELAKRTSVNASALFRVLRALESTGIFQQVSPRVFANTETSESLRKDVAGSQRAWILHNLSQGDGVFEAWNEIDHSVRTEEASLHKIYGHDLWELYRRQPESNAHFNDAMRSVSETMTPTVTAAYDWSSFAVIADIGGGIGTQLTSILATSPSSRGILFDQAHVRSTSMVANDRIEALGGDFFSSVPGGADAYLLRFILHDWSDSKALAILGSVRRAMKSTARLVVIESVIPEGPEFHFGKWLDLQMLVVVNGRERTEAEFRDLLAKAGFEVETIVPTKSPLSLLIAKPV